MKTSAEKLREWAERYVDEHPEHGDSVSWEHAMLYYTIYTAAAEIIDAMPDEEERLRLAILSGLIARGYESDVYEAATKQARAILAERDGGAPKKCEECDDVGTVPTPIRDLTRGGKPTMVYPPCDACNGTAEEEEEKR